MHARMCSACAAAGVRSFEVKFEDGAWRTCLEKKIPKDTKHKSASSPCIDRQDLCAYGQGLSKVKFVVNGSCRTGLERKTHQAQKRRIIDRALAVLVYLWARRPPPHLDNSALLSGRSWSWGWESVAETNGRVVMMSAPRGF